MGSSKRSKTANAIGHTGRLCKGMTCGNSHARSPASCLYISSSRECERRQTKSAYTGVRTRDIDGAHPDSRALCSEGPIPKTSSQGRDVGGCEDGDGPCLRGAGTAGTNHNHDVQKIGADSDKGAAAAAIGNLPGIRRLDAPADMKSRETGMRISSFQLSRESAMQRTSAEMSSSKRMIVPLTLRDAEISEKQGNRCLHGYVQQRSEGTWERIWKTQHDKGILPSTRSYSKHDEATCSAHHCSSIDVDCHPISYYKPSNERFDDTPGPCSSRSCGPANPSDEPRCHLEVTQHQKCETPVAFNLPTDVVLDNDCKGARAMTSETGTVPSFLLETNGMHRSLTPSIKNMLARRGRGRRHNWNATSTENDDITTQTTFLLEGEPLRVSQHTGNQLAPKNEDEAGKRQEREQRLRGTSTEMLNQRSMVDRKSGMQCRQKDSWITRGGYVPAPTGPFPNESTFVDLGIDSLSERCHWNALVTVDEMLEAHRHRRNEEDQENNDVATSKHRKPRSSNESCRQGDGRRPTKSRFSSKDLSLVRL